MRAPQTVISTNEGILPNMRVREAIMQTYPELTELAFEPSYWHAWY